MPSKFKVSVLSDHVRYFDYYYLPIISSVLLNFSDNFCFFHPKVNSKTKILLCILILINFKYLISIFPFSVVKKYERVTAFLFRGVEKLHKGHLAFFCHLEVCMH